VDRMTILLRGLRVRVGIRATVRGRVRDRVGVRGRV
jgi:hypothetical protein